MENKKGDFNCRICGHNDYGEVKKNNGIDGPGGRSWVEHCFCKGCGVMFHDPKLFSAPQPQTKD